jgi:hypothetical protein
MRTIEFVFALLDLNEDLGFVAIEGRVPTEEDVHDNSTRPYVAFLIILSLEDLRCNIVRLIYLLSKYNTVPNLLVSFSPPSIFLEVPKSMTLMLIPLFLFSKRMFSGLRSLFIVIICVCYLCTIFLSWQ